MKESLIKDGYKEFIEYLTWFSDSLYGSYETIWSSFCSKKSEGGEYGEVDSRELHKTKIKFEYNLMEKIRDNKDEEIVLAISRYPIVFKDVRFIPNKDPKMN